MFRLAPALPVLGSGLAWMLATGGGVLGSGGARLGAATALWFSNSRPMIDSEFTSAGEPMSWILQTSLLPDSGDMFQNAMVETAMALALAPTGVVTAAAFDESGVQLDRAAVAGFAPRPGGTQLEFRPDGLLSGAILAQRQIDWHTTLVFKQASLVVSGVSDANTAIGNLYLRYQRTGYMLTDPARAATLGLSFGIA